jgi:hypothetical protein
MHRFVRILGRAGCAPDAILAEAARACADIPVSWMRDVDSQDAGDYSHVMTLWFADPAYLDSSGRPRSIPLRGKTVSLEALAHRIDPKIDPRVVTRYLERGGVISRVGKRYVPKDRACNFQRQADVRPALRGFYGFLKTLDHNLQSGHGERTWLQLFARNPAFPLSALPEFEKRMRQWIHHIADRADSQMHRTERQRRRNEPTVRVGFGVYQFEEDPPPKPSVRRAVARRTKAGRRGR